MKLKVTITGSKVHDVGYRYLLLGGAMGLRLPGFYAVNLVELEKQMVEILIEGKEPQVKAFMEFVQNNKPANARVSDITTSEYEDDVPRRSEYTQDLTALQMLKAIPTILKIEENTKPVSQIAKNTEKIIDNTDIIIDEIRGIRGDLVSNREWQIKIEREIKEIKAKIGI